jgi:hypothetical protein
MPLVLLLVLSGIVSEIERRPARPLFKAHLLSRGTIVKSPFAGKLREASI